MELSLLLPTLMLLPFNKAPNPLNASCCYSLWHSSLTLLFVFDGTPHAPAWRRSSLTLLVLLLFNNPPLRCWYCSCFSLTLFFLLFFDATPFPPTLLRCNTFSSLMQLLLHATPALPILGTFLLPVDVVVRFLCCSYFSYFRLVFSPSSPSLSCLCRCGRIKLSKFNFFKPNLKVRLFSFKC